MFGSAYGCLPQEAAPFAGPAQPYLTDISDPAHPKTVVEFGLQINNPENCPEQLQANPALPVEWLRQRGPFDLIAGPSGYGLPLVRVEDCTDRDAALMTLVRPGDKVKRPSSSLAISTWRSQGFVMKIGWKLSGSS